MQKQKWFGLILVLLNLIVPLVWWQQETALWGRKAILLGVGELIGWFGFRFYQDQFRNRIGNIFTSAFFQILFLVFSFWLVVSSVSFLAYGLVLGINFYLLKKVIVGLQYSPEQTGEQLFGKGQSVDLKTYTAAIGIGLALIYLLVLL